MIAVFAPAPSLADTFRVTPGLGLQFAVTDNIENVSAGKTVDAVTTPFFGLDILGRTRRASLDVTGRVSYNKFISRGEFDDYNVELVGAGELFLIPDHFAINSSINISDLTPDRGTFGSVVPTGQQNALRVSSNDWGSLLTFRFFDIFDITVQGRYGEVELSQLSQTLVTASGATLVLPPEVNFLQSVGVLDTGTRSRRFQFTIGGEYLEENTGFLRRSSVYSLYTRLAPKTRIIGRFGYERTFDPGITDIDGYIWSAGVEFTPGPLSLLRVETGERYDRTIWDAEMALALSPKLFLLGNYLERLETQQSRIDRRLRSVLDLPTGFPSVSFTLPAFIDESLAGVTQLSKDLDVGLQWYSAPRRISLIGSYNRAAFFTNLPTEEFLIIDALYEENLTPQILLSLRTGAERRVETLAGEAQTTTYRSEMGIEYDINSNIKVLALYSWRKRYGGGDGEAPPQNVFAMSVQKTF